LAKGKKGQGEVPLRRKKGEKGEGKKEKRVSLLPCRGGKGKKERAQTSRVLGGRGGKGKRKKKDSCLNSFRQDSQEEKGKKNRKN